MNIHCQSAREAAMSASSAKAAPLAVEKVDCRRAQALVHAASAAPGAWRKD
jgi:hypothetical protein